MESTSLVLSESEGRKFVAGEYNGVFAFDEVPEVFDRRIYD